MNRLWTASALVFLALWGTVAPALAVPPTVTPSPGYDARLQESRRGTATMTLTPTPRPPNAKPKKRPHH